MKVLIWFGCLLLPSLIIAGLRASNESLGALPTILIYASMFILASFLCKAYDENKAKKEDEIDGEQDHSSKPIDDLNDSQFDDSEIKQRDELSKINLSNRH